MSATPSTESSVEGSLDDDYEEEEEEEDMESITTLYQEKGRLEKVCFGYIIPYYYTSCMHNYDLQIIYALLQKRVWPRYL